MTRVESLKLEKTVNISAILGAGYLSKVGSETFALPA